MQITSVNQTQYKPHIPAKKQVGFGVGAKYLARKVHAAIRQAKIVKDALGVNGGIPVSHGLEERAIEILRRAVQKKPELKEPLKKLLGKEIAGKPSVRPILYA